MKIYITFMFLLISVFCYAQELNIFKSKTSHKIFSTDFLEVGVKINSDETCCNYIHFEGTLTSFSKDSLAFNFFTSVINQKLNSSLNTFNLAYLNDNSNKIIAKDDILYIADYKSEKSKKTRENLSILGGIIMIGGLVTSLNALIFADNNKSDLLLAGGIQFGTGFAMGLGFNKSKKRFEAVDDPWKFE